jgi:DNA polymerase-3 subunit epsilon
MYLFDNKNFDDFSKRKLVFLDVESTGTNSFDNRITEIGALVYENGKLVDTFETLINPKTYIPYFLTQMTGISNEMVKNAPEFGDVSKKLSEVLEDAVFVAHNVAFDYNFIKQSFLRVGVEYSADHFCTVQLSRNLYPQHKRHGLDNIMQRMNIHCDRRHRAFDDAEVIYKFYDKAKQITDEEIFNNVIQKILKKK